ncbi:MAG: cation:proton antiporter [Vulcanimicrobiota bacterium]
MANPPDIFFLIGIMLVAGYIGGIISGRLKSPHVVFYVLVGLILGQSGFDIIDKLAYQKVEILSIFALAMIGFAIGGELRYSEIKELGKTIPIITIFQSLITFAFVLGGLYLLTQNWVISLIMAAISSATAPAATVNVLWQYNARGPLTTTILSVVGLDDAFTLMLFAFAASYARIIYAKTTQISLLTMFGLPLVEILGAIVVGVVLGYGLNYAVKYLSKNEEILLLVLGSTLLCAGVARTLHFSMLLSTMVMGITLINISVKNRIVFDTLHKFSQPFWVLMFVIVGSHLDYRILLHLGWIGLVYLAARSLGKITGSWMGAKISKAKEIVRKYLGLSLLSQAGVAVGLAIEASNYFMKNGPEGQKIATTIMTVTVATVFIFELIGPPLVKHAIFKAKEVDERFLKENIQEIT